MLIVSWTTQARYRSVVGLGGGLRSSAQRRSDHGGVESLTEQILIQPAELGAVLDLSLEAARQGAFKHGLFVVLGVDGGHCRLRVHGFDAARGELPGDAPRSAPLYHDGVPRVGRRRTAVIECALVKKALECTLNGLGRKGLPLQAVAELRCAKLAACQQRQAGRIRIRSHVRRSRAGLLAPEPCDVGGHG